MFPPRPSSKLYKNLKSNDSQKIFSSCIRIQHFSHCDFVDAAVQFMASFRYFWIDVFHPFHITYFEKYVMVCIEKWILMIFFYIFGWTTHVNYMGVCVVQPLYFLRFRHATHEKQNSTRNFKLCSLCVICISFYVLYSHMSFPHEGAFQNDLHTVYAVIVFSPFLSKRAGIVPEKTK